MSASSAEVEVVEVEPVPVDVEDCGNIPTAVFVGIRFLAEAFGRKLSLSPGSSSSSSSSCFLPSAAAAAASLAGTAALRATAQGTPLCSESPPLSCDSAAASAAAAADSAADGAASGGSSSDVEALALDAGLVPEPLAASAALSASEIAKEQSRLTADVAEVLAVDKAVAAALLRKYGWRREELLRWFLEDSTRVFAEVLPMTAPAPMAPVTPAGSVVECTVCGEEVERVEASALSCGHWCCNACWEQYLSLKIREGQVSFIGCPAHRCSAVVSEEFVSAHVSSELFFRYQGFLTAAFVDQSSEVKWCPRPGCTFALRSEQCHNGVCRCSCGFVSCWKCREEDHRPATCAELAEWKRKCSDESETRNWIASNTKACPKCHMPIEKDRGCLHMVCRACKHSFCWACLQDWRGHADFYSCTRFEKQKQRKRAPKKSERKRQAELEESRRALEKYLFYFERFQVHQSSSKFEERLQARIQSMVAQLQESTDEFVSSRFLLDAAEQLLACRRALRNSFLHAFFMPAGSTQLQLFEILQSDLEKATERLSELLEAADAKALRADIRDATALCAQVLRNILG